MSGRPTTSSPQQGQVKEKASTGRASSFLDRAILAGHTARDKGNHVPERRLPPDTADDAKLIADLRRELIACARAGETASYRDLAQRIGFPGPHAIHRLTLLLEGMVREDHAAGRPLLAALAVSRSQRNPKGDGIPGRGFFQLLAELGRYAGPDQGAEAAACHARELEAAQRFWSAHSTG
jgi:hypothetical protein